MNIGTAPLIGFVAGLGVAILTTPVGVSGALFLLPIQMSVLGVPDPAVTPTNLLFNIVSIPGALARHARARSLRSPLTRLMLLGTVPGVVIGAVLRVLLLPGQQTFRLFAAAVLLPLGVWLWTRSTHPVNGPSRRDPTNRFVAGLALGVGIVGGIYGIGGGSLLSPILAGRGVPIAEVAPAALVSTFITSVVGAATYTVLAALAPGHDIAPDWPIGIAAGIGGLLGGYAGVRLQPRVPEGALRRLLGTLAVLAAVLYVVQSVGHA